MQGRTGGRRIHDRFLVKLLYVTSGFFIGHWITVKFPGLISEASTDVAEMGAGVMDYFGGAAIFLNFCVFSFAVYKYFKKGK
jgi:hypothetical protein